MVPAQVRVLVARFSYGGNGGISSCHKKMVSWWGPQFHELKTDPRIGAFADVDISDTPIYMTRNKAIQMAKEEGFDFIWMIDSDNDIDRYVGTDIPGVKPFFKSSFDFAYERLLRGLPTVIAAPYCGPPPDDLDGGEEVPYIFYWKNYESDNPHCGHSLQMYTREHAAMMAGIAPCAAIATGCFLASLKAFDLVAPPYFDYEHDAAKTKKASTEDVFCTRNLSLAGRTALQEEIVFCNWDAWAGHVKEKTVGRPVTLSAGDVAKRYENAMAIGRDPRRKLQYLNFKRDMSVPAPQPVEKQADVEHVVNEQRLRDIFGHQCESLFFRTPMEDLRAMKEVVEFVHSRNPSRRLKVIEVGSWVGESAVAMACGLLDRNGVIYCVDHFSGSPTDQLAEFVRDNGGPARIRRQFDNNTREFRDVIRAFPMESAAAAKQIAGEEGRSECADLVLIDAGHTYEECLADIQAWLPHVASDGFLMVHDYDADGFPGVKKAVDETFGRECVHKIRDTKVAYVSIADWKEKQVPAAGGNGHVAPVPVTA